MIHNETRFYKILLNTHEYKGRPAFCVRGVWSDDRIVPILRLNKPPSSFFPFPEELKEPSTVAQKH